LPISTNLKKSGRTTLKSECFGDIDLYHVCIRVAMLSMATWTNNVVCYNIADVLFNVLDPGYSIELKGWIHLLQ
jgi:hypothetical protein